MKAVLHNREANTGKSGRLPKLPVGAQLLLKLKFWREDRTPLRIGPARERRETTVR